MEPEKIQIIHIMWRNDCYLLERGKVLLNPQTFSTICFLTYHYVSVSFAGPSPHIPFRCWGSLQYPALDLCPPTTLSASQSQSLLWFRFGCAHEAQIFFPCLFRARSVRLITLLLLLTWLTDTQVQNISNRIYDPHASHLLPSLSLGPSCCSLSSFLSHH